MKRYTLGTPNRKHISKAAARGHKKGVVDQCFADPKVKTYVVHKVLQILQSEMKTMCSLQVGSILRDNTSDGIKVFNWNSLTLSAHAREGYSSHFVCLSVCLLFYCGEGAVFRVETYINTF